jgi:hypothetical protein
VPAVAEASVITVPLTAHAEGKEATAFDFSTNNDCGKNSGQGLKTLQRLPKPQTAELNFTGHHNANSVKTHRKR